MISDKSPLLAGVIGSPIFHSKSPKLHNFWLKEYNINGYYIPMHVKSTNLKKSIESLITLGFRGVNVTLPHKTEVLSIADIITDRAAIIGAANTLFFSSSGKITADNTDGYGFIKNLYHYDKNWKPQEGSAVVCGAGGASKAIVHALLEEGVRKVKILNRTKSKAQLVAQNFGNKVEVFDWYSSNEAFSDATTVVNTTSLGMLGNPEFAPDFSTLPSNALVTDLVYNPIVTKFLSNAKKAGFPTVDGLGMLLYQAEIGFTNWFNFTPSVNDALKLYMMSNDE